MRMATKVMDIAAPYVTKYKTGNEAIRSGYFVLISALSVRFFPFQY